MSALVKEIEHYFKVTANLVLPFPFGGYTPADVAGLEEMRLVHGVVVAKGKRGVLHVPHSWIEGECEKNGTIVVEAFKGRLGRAPVNDYYRLRGVSRRETLRFDREKVRELILDTRHYGPWRGAPAHYFRTLQQKSLKKPEPKNAPGLSLVSSQKTVEIVDAKGDPLRLHDSSSAADKAG